MGEAVLFTDTFAVGAAVAPLALAISKRWRQLVTPAVLLWVLGYAVGNCAGVGVAYLLRGTVG